MRIAIAIFSIFTLPGVAAAALQGIGVASAVKGSVKAKAPDASVGRVLETGKDVYLNDHVTTNAEGKLQVLLKDETTFTLGPNSDMVLDEFVYDPKSDKGQVSATVAKGVFRFVTGKVARRDPSRMKVATPLGTIGIRGTMVAGDVKPEEATVVLIGPGRANNADETPGGIHVGNAKGSVDIDRSGYATTLKPDEAPSKPFEIPGGRLDEILNAVASAPSGSGKGGVGGKPGQTSGQDTALGRLYYAEASDALGQDFPEVARYTEQITSNGSPTWDTVRAIPGGTGQYTGSGTASGSLGSGTMSMVLNIDFGAQTLGGGSSILTATNGPVGFNTSSNILLSSYANLTGQASTSLSLSGGNFSSASLELQNGGGVTAGVAVVNATISSGGTATGTIRATR
jgi:hypothetical protein